MTDNLKFAGIALGTRIRAYDFEPRPGKAGCFVKGVITETQIDLNGAHVYVILCDKDSSSWCGYTRVGQDVYIPHETCFDYDSRVLIG